MLKSVSGLTLTTCAMLAMATATGLAGEEARKRIVERAAACWTEPVAMRGIRFAADADVAFTPTGEVSTVKIVGTSPSSPTYHELAVELADAMKRCGPYDTEGRTRMRLLLVWPV
jgi:hypothetical protein